MRTISGMERTLQYKAIKGKFLCSVFTLMLICTGGCGIVRDKYIIEQPFKVAQVKGIKRGETTKQQILEWFGPPVAIAREGRAMKIPLLGLRKDGSEQVRSETFFELFSAKHGLTEDHIIYYYYSSEIKRFDFFLLYGGPLPATEEKLIVNKLWVLIDAKTGIVEDYQVETSE